MAANRATARLLRLVPGAVVAVAIVVLLTFAGVGPGDLTRYALTTTLTVLAPGMMVYRAARGRAASLVEDLALGFCTGIALQLAAWFGFTALGVQRFLGLWPVLVIVPLAVWKRFRAAWTLEPYPKALHPVTSWALASATVMAVAGFVRTSASSTLPPSAWYPDTYWHLGAVAELMRTPFPKVPQVAELDFHYHWFVNAHMAAMSFSSGVDPVLVVARLWAVPLVLALFGVLVALAVALTGKAWPGALAAAMTAASAEILPGSWYRLPGSDLLAYASPSQIFGLPLTLFAILAVVPLLRDQRLRPGGWLIALLAVAALGGAKSSALPVLICGALLTLVVTAVRSRRWRGPALATALFATGFVAVTLPLSGASSAGAGIQILATFGRTRPWVLEMGNPDISGYRDWIMPELFHPGGVGFALVLLLAYFVAYAWLGLAVSLLRRWKPVAWFLFGVGLAGFCAMILLNHDGVSQVYFMRGAIIAWYLLAALSLVTPCDEAIRKHGRLQTAGVVLMGSGVGTVIVFLAQLAGGVPVQGQVTGSMALSFLVVAAGAAVLIAGSFVGLRGEWSALRAPLIGGAAIGAAAFPGLLPGGLEAVVGWPTPAAGLLELVPILLGASLVLLLAHRSPRATLIGICIGLIAPGMLVAGAAATGFRAESDRAVREAVAPLTEAELRGTRWLARYADPFAVVATNVHCLARVTSVGCDARAFWVSGLGQRRVLVEGWGYTEPAHAAHGIDGQSSRRAPFHDPDLYALNRRAFTAPNRDVLTKLKERGVRYLFANEGAGLVRAPDLQRLAKERFAEDGIYIFELR